MTRYLVFALIVGLAGAIHATDNCVEVTLELTPPEDPRGSQLRSFENWRQKPADQEVASDGNFAVWEYKFNAASDTRLGSATDTAAIKGLLPATKPPTIRWVSRSVVVVASGCYSDASSTRHASC